jgi:hypothetical protein
MAEALAFTLGGFGLSGSLSTCSSWGGPALWQCFFVSAFLLQQRCGLLGTRSLLGFLQGQASQRRGYEVFSAVSSGCGIQGDKDGGILSDMTEGIMGEII